MLPTRTSINLQLISSESRYVLFNTLAFVITCRISNQQSVSLIKSTQPCASGIVWNKCFYNAVPITDIIFDDFNKATRLISWPIK